MIVEPGSYETPVFGNIVMAADEVRTHTYGAVKEVPAKVNAALSSSAGNTFLGDKQLAHRSLFRSRVGDHGAVVHGLAGVLIKN